MKETMKIYNTLTRQIEPFEPMHESKINFFICGPTAYDFPHLGHAKTYIQFDFIVKYLRSLGYDVFCLMNITNIDDKIIRRAEQTGANWKELSDKFTQYFYEDLKALHIDAINKFAPATDYIDAIVKQVEVLLDKGFAYKTSDGIYFEIAKFPGYGKLSRRTEIQEFDGVSRIDASPEKRGWNDFCLWKNYKEGEPFWETKLGKGRPGWHIEDTAITSTLFGPKYDIHGGGADIMFPHHEAEIAQMESASGKSPLAKYWMHVGLLNVDSKKMGKSLGNFLNIRDVLKTYDYRTLRYFFLSSHYRSQINFTNVALDSAKGAIMRLNEFLFKAQPNLVDVEEEKAINDLDVKVTEALNNDFNTPQALSELFDFIRQRNQNGIVGKATYEYFMKLDKLFSFIQADSSATAIDDTKIEALVKARDVSRASGEYIKADAIRDELDSLGIQVYDSSEGSSGEKSNATSGKELIVNFSEK